MTTQTKPLTPYQVLATARLLVFNRAPYFRAGVLQLVPRETPGLGTFASTKDWVMMWDPAKAVEWGIEKTAGAIVHELWHLVRDHFGRFSAPLINADLANIAGDLSINPGVQEMGFQLPPEGLWPKMFDLPDGLTAEQYYERLSKMDVRYAYLDAGGHQHQVGAGTVIMIEGCGSCSGRKRRDEPEDSSATGRTEAEVRRTRITIAKAVQQHRGHLPSELRRWCEDTLKPPKVNWREKLARACRNAVAFRPGSGYSTYTKLSRRQAGLGFGAGCPVLPSYRATTPRATLLVDTSGSMQDESLKLAMSEAQGILDVCGARLDVMVCDAAVHGAKQVRSIKEACEMLKGGGGSDFRPAFDELAKKTPKVELVIAATDGDITVPERQPPGMNVIWLLVQPSWGGGFRRPCSWGTAIEVE